MGNGSRVVEHFVGQEYALFALGTLSTYSTSWRLLDFEIDRHALDLMEPLQTVS